MHDRPLRLSRLYVVLDEEAAHSAGWTLPDLARACLAGGARFLQIRAKRLSSRDYLSVCEKVMSSAAAHGAIVIVNDRADLARLCGAAGVHVGQEDLPPSAARRVIGHSAIVGLSTHTPEQVREGLLQPVDYIAVGPVFGTSTKETGYAAVNLELVSWAATLTRSTDDDAESPVRPIVAIGGITLSRARAVIEAGAASVAVISDLITTGDPESRVREYLEILSE